MQTNPFKMIAEDTEVLRSVATEKLPCSAGVRRLARRRPRRRRWKSRRAPSVAHRMSELAAHWRRLAVALALSLAVALLLRPTWMQGLRPLLARTMTLGLIGLLAFTVFERWPRRLPRWIARWVLQVAG